MRKNICSLLLLGIPLFAWGPGPQEKPKETARQQENAGVPQSPRITIPSPPPAAATPDQPEKPAAADKTTTPSKEADPAKLAPTMATPGAPLAGSLPVGDSTFVIGAEDELQIMVWGEPRLSGNVRVRPDGKISMNLIGDIQAAGRTPVELKKDVADYLRAGEFMRSPQVTVGLIQVNSRKYYMDGEINRTGAFPLVVPTRILEALVNAGGFKDFAKKGKIRIMRFKDGKLQQEYKFDWNAVIKGKKLDENILLEPGDHIIVP